MNLSQRELEEAVWSAFTREEQKEMIRQTPFLFIKLGIRLAILLLPLLLFMLLLWGCTPQIPKLPKGIFCWQDGGYIVCQFIPADDIAPATTPH